MATRILILGGTGLTGPHIVRELVALGHDVTVFHRGKTPALPAGAREMLGDAGSLAEYQSAFAELRPEVVIGMMTLTRRDAEQFVATFKGIAGRAVVVSSADVYLAFGRLHGTEPGPLIEEQLAETSALRTKVSLGGEGYDKIGVEAVLREQGDLPTTIIRYPAVYGPGDHQHRFYDEVRRMADGRPAILLTESIASWRFAHGYAADVAQAVVLAAVRPEAAGQTFNVAERETPVQKERIEQLGSSLGWQGQVVVVPDGALPDPTEALRDLPGYAGPPDLRQHLVLDSRRLRSVLGYSERGSVEDGLRATAEWLLANPPPDWKANYDEEDAILASLQL